AAFAKGLFYPPVQDQPHRRLRRDARLRIPIRLDGIAVETKEVLQAAGCLFEQESERTLGCFELKAIMLELLYSIYNFLEPWFAAADVDAHLGGFVQDVALARKIRDQNSTSVAGQLGVHVFVGYRIAHDGAHVDSAFVGKSAPADEWQIGAMRQV